MTKEESAVVFISILKNISPRLLQKLIQKFTEVESVPTAAINQYINDPRIKVINIVTRYSFDFYLFYLYNGAEIAITKEELKQWLRQYKITSLLQDN